MPLEIDITIEDRATNGLRRLSMAIEGDQINEVVGSAAMEIIKAHLQRLDSERPNALGGRRTHFYATAAEGTSFTTKPDGATVSVVKEGIKTRLLGTSYLPGGAILPVNAKNLAIPAVSEAYGKSPREFDDLVPVYRRVDGAVQAIALAQAEQQPVKLGKTRKSGGTSRGRVAGGTIFYWLVKSVVQDADPTVMPDAEEIIKGAYDAVDRFFSGLTGEVSGV